MTCIKKPDSIKEFVKYYLYLEKPNKIVINLFEEIERLNLYDKINIVCADSLDDEPQNISAKTIFVQPNGIIFWDSIINYDFIINECMDYINSSLENVRIHLTLKKELIMNTEIETKMNSNMSIDAFEKEVHKKEVSLKKYFENYNNWKVKYKQIKSQKIDDVLDRYTIQSEMYKNFGHVKYQKKMEKWEKVLKLLSNL